jgi:hypothetical protein
MLLRGFRRFCANYQRRVAGPQPYWFPLHAALCRLCEHMPHHQLAKDVYTKVRMINRAYLAGLGFAREAEWKLAQRLANGQGDSILAAVPKRMRFSPEALPTVLDAHEQLVDLAFRVTRKIQNSFAAKYLHFHRPDTIPIFDRLAYNGGWRIARPSAQALSFCQAGRNYDYRYFCGSLIEIMEGLNRSGGSPPSLKWLDVLLCEIG